MNTPEVAALAYLHDANDEQEFDIGDVIAEDTWNVLVAYGWAEEFDKDGSLRITPLGAKALVLELAWPGEFSPEDITAEDGVPR